MNIHSVSSQNPVNVKSPRNVMEDPQIKNLEQKLLQLSKEKEDAKKAKDLDKVRELEQKIQKIERRLEELRKKNAQKENEAGTDKTSSQPPIPKDNTGNYVDETV